MFEEDNDDKIYNLIISNGQDKENEYRTFVERIYSKPDFLWKESISPSYATAGDDFFNKIDAIILLSGLYSQNKELFDDLIKQSEKYDIPIVLIRPYGMEEVPLDLEKHAKSIVGWNANCITDAIRAAVNDEEFEN